tara:strand:+ start:782 stop:1057 length:276 start_codon:yes stop_codon:yes gene_type:complete
MSPTFPPISDEEIIEHYVFEMLKIGCRECGENREGHFFYEAGVQDEDEHGMKNGLKWYMAKAYCQPCDIHYDELFEVRGELDESNKNSKET